MWICDMILFYEDIIRFTYPLTCPSFICPSKKILNINTIIFKQIINRLIKHWLAIKPIMIKVKARYTILLS
ncbi:hypothetical protein ACH48_17775 [Aeromonas caviae]|nr:hypothetical protein ACH48_17775 [Aeromonas caviae]